MSNATLENHRRKSNSIFDEQVKAINSFEIGTIYKVADMRKRMKVGSYNTERVGDYHLDLLSTKCIERVKHGQYRVLGHIPDFLTLNMCEANRGYTTYCHNPKYIGKSATYGIAGDYSYINNERPMVSCSRGKTWKLGEPNPYLVKQEVDLNAINQNGTTAQQEAAFKIVSLLHEGAIIQAVDTTDLRLVIIIAIVNSEARVKLKNGSRALVPLINLKHVKVVEKFEAEEVKEEDKDRPAAAFSEAELIDKKNYILAFIVETENAISKPGGWIGRDANWAQIELAKKDLLIIEVELKYRREKHSNTNKKQEIVNILKQGLSASDAADLILKLS